MRQQKAAAQQTKGGGGGGAAAIAETTEGKRRRVTGDGLEDPLWATAWEAVLRKKAILKGALRAKVDAGLALFGSSAHSAD